MTEDQERPSANPDTCIRLEPRFQLKAVRLLGKTLTQIESLRSLIRQLEATVLELQDSPNFRDQEQRLNEMAAYHRQIGLRIERLRNEGFRRNPAKGLRRAILREEAKGTRANSETKDDTNGPSNRHGNGV